MGMICCQRRLEVTGKGEGKGGIEMVGGVAGKTGHVGGRAVAEK